MLLPDDHEVRLVREEGKHYQVSISSIKAVPRVGVVLRLRLGLTDVVHHLVFTLTWHR
jgi:hypothetical protein